MVDQPTDFDEIWHGFHDPYSGPIPPPSAYRTILSPEAKLAIGDVIIGWGILDQQTDHVIDMLSLHHRMPPDQIGTPKSRDYLARLNFLIGEIGKRYHDRQVILVEARLMRERILAAKLVRDTLAHGSYFSKHDAVPDIVDVQYKGQTKAINLANLVQTAQDLYVLAGAVREFHHWANYQDDKRLFEASKNSRI